MGNNSSTPPDDYMRQAKKCIEENKYKEAVRCYYLFCLRTYQDIECSTDKSNSAAINMKELFFIPLFNIYKNEIAEFLTLEYYLEIAREVKNDTENDKLSDPLWINKYGMSVFSGETNTLHPQEKWKELRLNKINECIDKLSLIS